MKRSKFLLVPMAFLIALALASVAMADTVAWTSWTGNTASTVTGTLTVGLTTVNVTFSGPYSFAQLNDTGVNWWTNPATYQSAIVSNAPSSPDIIGLGTGGSKTITFSQPVEDPLLALVSWNGNTVDFGVPITVLSNGCGYWGCGTPILNGTGTGFYGSGEVHGVIELPGTFTSITFTDTSEGWHGFTIGVVGLPGPGPEPGPVPEPTSLLLLGTGLAGIALAAWRKKK